MSKYFSNKAQADYQENSIERVSANILNEALTCVIWTNHAYTRKKQRGIKRDWISLVLAFGDETFQHAQNTVSYALGKKGIKNIQQQYGNRFDINKLRSLYLVMSHDNVLITCAYR
jgi:hypothetical protein